VWKHVAQSLSDLPIRVGRVDCTRFTTVATEFAVKGFPTIMLLKGEEVFTYEGDRTREDIVAFARRLLGPAVVRLHNRQELQEAERVAGGLFFLFVGREEGELYSEFLANARHFQKDEFMFSCSPELVIDRFELTSDPAIYIFKDSTWHPYTPPPAGLERVERADGGEVETAVTPKPEPVDVHATGFFSWLMAERFPLFVKVTRGRFGNIMATNKFLVIAVLEENKLMQIEPDQEQFRDMLKEVIEMNREAYHKHFQFGWTGTPDLANSVAMEQLSLPNLLVINSTTYQHHLPEDHPPQLTPEAIKIFLDSVLAGEAPAYGGSSWLVRLSRAVYEGRTAMVGMWRGNPVLTALLLGLPFGFLSLIFYSICCADIMDAEEEDEGEFHEKDD
jgi:thioredoxin domain-containing protein 10